MELEDTRIVIDNRKGVNSTRYRPGVTGRALPAGRYRPGPRAPPESYSAAFTRWYPERLAS